MQRPDVKHLRAVVALAEERHFSRAAARLRIGQSGLTKQIVAVESFLGFLLFVREPKRVRVTPAGEIFVAEAKLALQHLDRAINLSRAATEHAGLTVHVGRTPYTDPYLITKLLSLRLPLYPKLEIELVSRLAGELAVEVLDGTLDLAFLTNFPETPKLSGSVVADQDLWIAMTEDDPLSWQREVGSNDLADRSCILLSRHVQPNLYDDYTQIVKPATAPGCHLHHVMTAEDALQLVLRGAGVAVLPQTAAWRIMRSGVTIRPLHLDAFKLTTQLVARADNGSMLVSDVVRSLKKSLAEMSPTKVQQPLFPGILARADTIGKLSK